MWKSRNEKCKTMKQQLYSTFTIWIDHLDKNAIYVSRGIFSQCRRYFSHSLSFYLFVCLSDASSMRIFFLFMSQLNRIPSIGLSCYEFKIKLMAIDAKKRKKTTTKGWTFQTSKRELNRSEKNVHKQTHQRWRFDALMTINKWFHAYFTAKKKEKSDCNKFSTRSYITIFSYMHQMSYHLYLNIKENE